MKEIICKNYIKIIKVIWWIILLIVSSIYIFSNYDRLIITPTTIDIIILLALLIILFMPLVSEVSMFGMSIKKEIENTKNEMKNEFKELKYEIKEYTLSNSFRSDINIGIGQDSLPPKESIKDDINKVESNLIEVVDKKNEDDIYGKFTLSEDQLYLYKVKYTIEKYLNNIIIKLNINGCRGINTMINVLAKNETIDIITVEYIRKVSSICNRGIHGEIVDNEYITYVKNIFPVIVDRLEEIDSLLLPYICSKCGYRGYSIYSNVCPICGFVSDDY